MRAISEIRTLQNLDIQANVRVTNDGLLVLTESLLGLEYLNIKGCHRITWTGLMSVPRAWRNPPAIRIIY